MIKALFKFAKTPQGSLVIDTTSNSGNYRGLSPFMLPSPPAENFENLWQFSKVYASQVDQDGNPTNGWFWWRRLGFADARAHRYPMGKGAIPLYSIYPQPYDNRETKHLGYIDARKRIYAPEYAKNVAETDAYQELERLYHSYGKDIILLDYDAYDHQALGMSLRDVINRPDKKMGHAFVLMMMLKGELEECIEL